MYKIVNKKEISKDIKALEIEAPLIARNAKVGQFVILRIDESGERIPLTIADLDSDKGIITLVFLEIGKTTKKLGNLNIADSIANISGPLGKPSEIENYGRVVCIGGGVGIACIYPVLKAMKEKGNYVIAIIGARNESLLMFEKEIRALSDEFYLTTDDGSAGRKGFVSDVLKELIEKEAIDRVITVGPLPMMKKVAEITKEKKIKTIASLNPIMLDGTGMCGGCRVIVGGERKFACVDGPEFDAHLVDFDNLILRNQRFLGEEDESLKRYGECHGKKDKA